MDRACRGSFGAPLNAAVAEFRGRVAPAGALEFRDDGTRGSKAYAQCLSAMYRSTAGSFHESSWEVNAGRAEEIWTWELGHIQSVSFELIAPGLEGALSCDIGEGAGAPERPLRP